MWYDNLCPSNWVDSMCPWIAHYFTFNYLKNSYFTKGWDYFIEQEGQMLTVLCFIVTVLDYMLGCSISCIVTHWVLILFTRRLLAGGICTSNKRLDGKTVVITGCNIGIGKETAKEMSMRGAKVIMACRDTRKAEKAAADIKTKEGGELVVMNLDLSSMASIKAFVEDLKAQEKQLHMLINNAGIMFCPFMKTEDGFEMQMGTNHLGHFLLTNLLLPMLTHSEPARIINVASTGHLGGVIPLDDMYYKKGYDKYQAYFNSKLANVLFTRQLGKKLKGTNIQVFSLHPGAVHTNLGQHLMGGLITPAVTYLLKSPNEGMQTTLYCALEAEQDNEHYYFSDCAVGYSSTLARDDDLAEKLWEVSEKMVGLNK